VIDFPGLYGPLELQQVAGECLAGNGYRIVALEDFIAEGPANEPDGLTHRVTGSFLGVSRPEEFTQLVSSDGTAFYGQKTEKRERFSPGKLNLRTLRVTETRKPKDLESIGHEDWCQHFLVCEAGGLRSENASATWVSTTTLL
jgi:hypothetical protein